MSVALVLDFPGGTKEQYDGGGWCVIDRWTSKEIYDRFMERTRHIIEKAPLSGPPTIEDLAVQATLPGNAPAPA